MGAYTLDALGTGKVAGSAEMGGTGAGAGWKGSARRVRGSGDLNTCASNANPANCGAILQIGLVPLVVDAAKVASGGFGDGVRALVPIPAVSVLPPLAVASSLAGADLALLTRLQAAKRAEVDSTTFAGKADAWKSLAMDPNPNAYKDFATRRRDEWMLAASAEERRHLQVSRACQQVAVDRAKLAGLLRLDDDVVSAKQKLAYKAELRQVYAPYSVAMEECVPLLCGRYRVVEAGSESESSTDFVRDTQTGLIWLRYRGPGGQDHAAATSYCSQLGMRLPTKREALAIAGGPFCREAWPSAWWTWTSTVSQRGRWFVDSLGSAYDSDAASDQSYCGGLCVRE